MNKLISLLLIIPSLSLAEVRVAVIDSGIIWKNNKIHLCSSGHTDFTESSLNDAINHGNEVSQLIDLYSENTNHCQIILKSFGVSSGNNVEYVVKAINKAIELKVDIINFSGGGPGSVLNERNAVLKALDQGIIIVVAAGNGSINLDKDCNYFPACYDKRIIVVGNKTPQTNYGKIVDVYEPGIRFSNDKTQIDGTSRSTAIITGKIIKLLNERHR